MLQYNDTAANSKKLFLIDWLVVSLQLAELECEWSLISAMDCGTGEMHVRVPDYVETRRVGSVDLAS